MIARLKNTFMIDEKQEKRKSVLIRHPSHPLLPVELTEKAQRMCNWQQRWSFPGGLVHTAFTSYPLPPMHDGTPLNASQIDRSAPDGSV